MPAAGRSGISAHRRSMVTATAAGAVLCALWFVPSAKATPDAAGAGGGARHAVTSSSSPDSASYPESYSGSSSDSGPASSGPGSSASGEERAAVAAERSGEDGLTSPFILSALGLAGTAGVLIVRARRRASAAAEAGSPGAVSQARSQGTSQASSPVTD
ncbi:hypothetical protein [Streptomyces winkii]|uniref:hypothetical protein n=1 Tax=Streptomyces winkii TaxID=3051178 RepID=UPI0028D308EA|nr:hypothetical protein [Streptomyces sp. DSM 40971]